MSLMDLTFQDPKSLVNRAAFNDRFSLINKLFNEAGNEYIWKVELRKAVYEEEVPYTTIDAWSITSSIRSSTYVYADSIDKLMDNRDTKTVEVSYNTYTNANVLAGNYFYNTIEKNPDGSKTVTYMPPDATVTRRMQGTTTEIIEMSKEGRRYQKTKLSVQFIKYVSSFDENAYPPVPADEYTYTALGQAGDKVRISTGSYTGTGTFGSSNPNSITFEKGIPYIVIITTSGSASGQIIGLFVPKTLPNSYVKGSYRMLSDNSVTSSDMYSKVDGNTLYWYSTAMNWQLNTKDTYDYYAFY